MSNTYQRKKINVFISSQYQEMFYVWNVPLDKDHNSPDNLVISYTFHQLFDKEMSNESKAEAMLVLIKERAGIRQYIQSRYREEPEYLTMVVYQKYFRRLIRYYFNFINIMDEYVDKYLQNDPRVKEDLIEIERKMKATDLHSYLAFLALINNYMMEKYDKS